MDILDFCQIECDRQGTDKIGEMYQAWQLATKLRYGIPTINHILTLASKIEPDLNFRGFRNTPVSFPDGNIAVSAQNVRRLVEQLLDVWEHLEPQEVFQEFERIHPFADGNGRLGQILYNWRAGTLHDPEFASEYVN